MKKIKKDFYCFRETAKNERCETPCATNGKCMWEEPKTDNIKQD